MEKRVLQAAVPKFDKVPWLSEASLTNKPLVLSLPNRSYSSATFLTSPRGHVNSPLLFQGPDVSSKTGRNQTDSGLLRNKWLCASCREEKMVQPRTMTIPDDLKLSFKNFMNHREYSLQAAYYGSQDRRLPRTAVRCLQNSSGDSTLFLAQKEAQGQSNKTMRAQPLDTGVFSSFSLSSR
ncbi:uncharacterized protein C1orf105 homolog isoform X3 [Octodon degus]|uniref:Uncharacterized protein C1orf105 homolog isoform X3 n=1 Tax=Octodon degus TaxID=10160 RepID=A0A6P6E1G1_OCTDE|nr:uncharacterized protein C1orf105 homolog isoform X3 [Octodon degus]